MLGLRLQWRQRLPAAVFVPFAGTQGKKHETQRDDALALEFVWATVEWVDACLMDVEGYAGTGKDAAGWVRTALGKMHADADAQREKNKKSGREDPIRFRNKLIADAVTVAFAALNRPTEWESFYNHDLPLVTSLDDDVMDLCIREKLNKNQAKALFAEASDLAAQVEACASSLAAARMNPSRKKDHPN